MSVLPLDQVFDTGEYGGKAFHLGAARRAGLPVPYGVGVSVAALAAIVRGEAAAVRAVSDAVAALGGAVACRSSAVGEDAEDASFAGQHLTLLNLHGAAAVLDGLRRVYDSAHGEAALGYRKRRGLTTDVRIAAVVQRLVDPVCAGVLFTRNPVTGADERVVEAAWGLGETVVAGLVTPDQYRVARDGRVLEARAGEKDVAIRRDPDGGTAEAPVEPALVHARCLDDRALGRLHELALRAESHFGKNLDLEWAFVGPDLFLLQSRPISTGSK